MNFVRTTIFATTAAVLTAASAHAATPTWSASATSCVPDAASIENNSFTTANGRVAHRAGNVDPIKLICQVSGDPSQFPGGVWRIVLTYRDSTETSASAHVAASLFRISRSNGSQTGVATFDSNTNEGVLVRKSFTQFSHTFNFDASYYFVQLVLDRTLPNEIVEAYGVALEFPF
jgi:hypothetical protein